MDALRGWTVALLAALALALTLGAKRLARPRAAGAGDRSEAGMTFLGHVQELRRRLAWCAAAVLAGTTLAFSVRWAPEAPFFAFGIQRNLASQAYAWLLQDLVPPGVTLVVARPTEAIQVELTLAFAIGVAAALPVLWWQAWGFFATALRPNERRAVGVAVLPALALFALGATVCYLFLVPFLLEALYGYADALGVDQKLLTAGELGQFTAVLALAGGIAFQTPLVMTAMGRFGLASPAAMLRKWRHAFVTALVAAAFFIDGSIVTLALVVAPLMGLYLLGVAGAAVANRGAAPSGA